MSLPIISADERLAEKNGVKACIFGAYGVGKTTLLWTLPTQSTLFIDVEAGDKPVKHWKGPTLRPTTWPEFRQMVVFLAGPNHAVSVDSPYSKIEYDRACEQYGDPNAYATLDTFFVDSITVLARWCFDWCKDLPQCVSEKTGNPDLRSAYGIHAHEMLAALTHLQHARDKNVIFVGILDEIQDEFNRKVFIPQLEGSKTGRELPGIVDQVSSLLLLKDDDGKEFRALVNHKSNPYGVPAKDRSGCLDVHEPPDLSNFLKKASVTEDISKKLVFTLPQSINQGE